MDENKSEDENSLFTNERSENECFEGGLEWDNLGTELHDQSTDRKRKKSEKNDESSEDSFITVSRRKSKRSNKRDSTSDDVTLIPSSEQENVTITKNEVIISFVQLLPKQMAMAKLLREENIKNILSIRYKSPYKVIIQVEKKEDAENLLKCPKFIELGWRCQMAYETSVSYGIIKGIDLEMKENEILEVMNSSVEIISIKRLNRINVDGKWTESETIRVCFRSSTLPSYVYAYGCRLTVEKFTFPVTQCSKCWKYGHFKNFCPSKHTFCPKCGGLHENCETKVFNCLNCKGPHMVLDKTCPWFLKEKRIRDIMAEENATYRRALQIYINKYKTEKQSSPEFTNLELLELPPITRNIVGKTYSSVVSTKADVHSQETNSENIIEEEKVIGEKSIYNNEKTSQPKKKTKNKQCKISQSVDYVEEAPTVNIEETRPDDENKKGRKIDLWKLFLKVKEIILSKETIENKIILALKVVFEECKSFIFECITGGEILSKIFHQHG